MRKSLVGAALLMALGACRSGELESGLRGSAQAAPPPPSAGAVPAGTLVAVRLDQTLSTRRNRVGDRFTATVTQPLVAHNGQIVIPAGAIVTGVVTGVDDSDHLGDQAAIRVDFERIGFRGRSHRFEGEVVDTEIELEDEEERIAERAAIGAVAGAALGAIVGGELKDILIGGALGAGVGTIISLGVGDVEAELPAGSEMTLRTTEAISLR